MFLSHTYVYFCLTLSFSPFLSLKTINTSSKKSLEKRGVHGGEMEEKDKSGFLGVDIPGTANLVNPLSLYT